MRFRIFIIFSIFFSLFLFCPAQAADYGLKAAVDATGGALPTSIKGASNIVELAGVIVNVALSLIGIFFFILMLYAGITWMKAMGSSEDVTKAKDMITQAIIGLVIIMAAYAISNFVFSSLAAGGGGGGGAGGGGGTVTYKDGEKCSTASIKTGKWNCGAGSKSGVSCSTGECQTPCRYSHADGVCQKTSTCAAPKTTANGLCPDDPADVTCCFAASP